MIETGVPFSMTQFLQDLLDIGRKLQAEGR